MEENTKKFIQQNSLDGGFLQSEEWRKFQEKTGKRTFHIELGGFWANIVEHVLPAVGSYFYIPRWPSARISNFQFPILNKLIKLSKDNNVDWIRIEPDKEEILKTVKENIRYTIKKAPHDIQPKEILMLDITKSEEELLAEMKPKTRYNIRLSQKRGVFVKVISNFQFPISKKYIDEFLKLVKITAKRDNITPHPENYYRKMFEVIPPEILKLYIAEYDNPASTRKDDCSSTRGGKIIAANLVVFYGKVATYLHGASDSEYRNVMAPYLLQWQAILDAKKSGCEKYDLGGVATKISNNWSGITRFKTGFSPNTKSVEFPGSYDIILNYWKYFIYQLASVIMRFIK